MFDLSVGTKQQSRAATKFREFLIVQGLEMSQLSVYARCNGKDSYESHLHTIEGTIP
jgi:CRISPR-associated protein Cas2